MIWGLLTVIVIGLLILFTAPYLSFLAPGDHIWLVDTAYSGDSGHRLRFNRTPTIPSFSLTLFLPYLSGLCQFSH